MNNRPQGNLVSARTSKGRLSGVLETIAAGLSLVLARPYLIALPIAIDLITWLGLQFTATSLIEPLRRLMIDNGGADGPAAARELGRLSERVRINDVLASLTPSVFGGLPRESFLNILMSVLAPPLSRGVDRADMYGSWGDGFGDVRDPGNWFAVLAVAAGFLVLATIVIVLFRVSIARALRADGESDPGFLRECIDGWVRLVALGLLFLTGGVLVIGPLLIGIGVLVLLGIDLVALVAIALFVIGGLIALYTYLTLDAMFMARLGPVASVRTSVAVVRQNMSATARLVLATVILATGALQIWSTIVQNIPGIAIALVGNAVLGTGLSIASMMFFQERSRTLPLPANRQSPPAANRR